MLFSLSHPDQDVFIYSIQQNLFLHGIPKRSFLAGLWERENGWNVCSMDSYGQEHWILPYLYLLHVFLLWTFFIILNCAWDNSWFLKVQRLNLLINFSDYQGINATHTAKTIMTSLPIWWWCMKKASPGTQNQQARLWHGPSKVWWVTEAETGPVLLRKESRKSPFLCLLYHGSFLWKIILALTKKSQTWNKLDFYFIPL